MIANEYKYKFNTDGIVERAKSRLVAKGFTQGKGIDFHDTFSPFANFSSICCLVVVTAIKD